MNGSARPRANLSMVPQDHVEYPAILPSLSASPVLLHVAPHPASKTRHYRVALEAESSAFPEPLDTPTAFAKAKLQAESRSTVKLRVFGLDMTKWTGTQQFCMCAFGVFSCYFAYGYLQESIFRMPGYEYGLFLTFFQFTIYSSISLYQYRAVRRERNQGVGKVQDMMEAGDAGKTMHRAIPITSYATLAFLSVCTMALSNVSVQYLNYPTQVIFKSCKLVPVMFVGVVYLHKQYTTLEYLAVLVLAGGMVLFSAGDNLTNAKLDPFGVLLISGALTADALIGNMQEKVMRDNPQASTPEMMFYSKLIGCGYLLLALVVKGELFPAVTYYATQPSVFRQALLFALVGCVGEYFVMALVRRFDALITVMTTSCRKIFTIVLSFWLFPKPFTWVYAIGGFLVLLGMSLNVYVKNSAQVDNAVARIVGRCCKNRSVWPRRMQRAGR